MNELRAGVDIVDVRDVAESLDQFGEQYLNRIFSDAELASATEATVRDIARCFAAKEAAMKVIGCEDNLDWRSIEVHRTSEGSQLHLTGKSAESARKLGLHRWSISTSITDDYAFAVALAAVKS